MATKNGKTTASTAKPNTRITTQSEAAKAGLGWPPLRHHGTTHQEFSGAVNTKSLVMMFNRSPTPLEQSAVITATVRAILALQLGGSIYDASTPPKVMRPIEGSDSNMDPLDLINPSYKSRTESDSTDSTSENSDEHDRQERLRENERLRGLEYGEVMIEWVKRKKEHERIMNDIYRTSNNGDESELNRQWAIEQTARERGWGFPFHVSRSFKSVLRFINTQLTRFSDLVDRNMPYYVGPVDSIIEAQREKNERNAHDRMHTSLANQEEWKEQSREGVQALSALDKHKIETMWGLLKATSEAVKTLDHRLDQHQNLFDRANDEDKRLHARIDQMQKNATPTTALSYSLVTIQTLNDATEELNRKIDSLTALVKTTPREDTI